MPLHYRATHAGLRVASFLAGGLIVVLVTSNVGGITAIGTWWSSAITLQKLAVWTLVWELLGVPAGPRHGGPYHWLQTETLRLPPWPHRVPFTRGSRRSVLDVGLYGIAVCVAAYLLFSGITGGRASDTLPRLLTGVLIGSIGLLGLRDRTAFLAARPEWFGPMLVIFTFPVAHQVFALKLALIAAVGHLFLKAWMRRRAPQLSPESLLFLGYAGGVLFAGHPSAGPSTLPGIPLTISVFVLLLTPLALRIRFPGPQGVAWLFREDGAAQRFDLNLVKPDPLSPTRRPAGVPRPLLYRAVENGARYTAYDGEAIAGLVLGRGPGSSDVPAKPLVDAVQYECDFRPGQVRVVEVRGRRFLRPRRQEYRIIDAAGGVLEAGTAPAVDPRRAGDSLAVEVTFAEGRNASRTFPAMAVAPEAVTQVAPASSIAPVGPIAPAGPLAPAGQEAAPAAGRRVPPAADGDAAADSPSGPPPPAGSADSTGHRPRPRPRPRANA